MESAGTLLRDAREGAHLSIRALAARAGVAASTVTRIEHGTLEPTYSTLARLLEHTGNRLQRTPANKAKGRAASPAGTAAPTRLADLARAWRGAPRTGEPDWTALRGTLDVLLQHPEHIPAAISEPPRRPSSPVQRALLAALAERLAISRGLSPPGWARHTKALDHEWAPPGTPRMIEAWRAATLPELRDRNLTVDEHTLFRDGAPVRPQAPTLASA